MPLSFFKAKKTPPLPAVPAGERVYAIGDVHGCLQTLDELIYAIVRDDLQRKPKRTTLVLLGDLVDRGPDSAGVVERVIGLKAPFDAVHVLAGNHEEILLESLAGEIQALRLFAHVGGRETALSYGISEYDYERSNYDELRTLLREHVPQRHIDFLEGLEEMAVIGDYAFVHAGIRPGVPLEDQTPADLRWIRERFLDSTRDHGKTIVHGHSVSDGVDERPNRIGIDTGAFATGRLTAIGLEGTERWYLATGGMLNDGV
jgi:serine/threonine protein phosphatase 1